MGFLEFGFGFEHQPEPEPYIKLVSTLHAKCIAKMLFPTPGVVYHEDLTVHVTVHVIERYMKLRMRRVGVFGLRRPLGRVLLGIRYTGQNGRVLLTSEFGKGTS